MEGIDKLIKYIKDNYNKNANGMNNIGGNSNIKRHTYFTMSGYVENAVAILINDILEKKGKKYKYLIDAQLSVDKNLIRPDILIYDDDNKIHGLVEIKSQLGYAGNFNEGGSYTNRITRIREANSISSKIREKSDDIFNLTNERKLLKEKDKEKYCEKIKDLKNKIEKLENENIVNYTASENCVDFVVILMPTNDHGNLDKFKGTSHFVLFQSETETVWYNNLDKKFLNTDDHTTEKLKGHTYDDLVKYLEENF